MPVKYRRKTRVGRAGSAVQACGPLYRGDRGLITIRDSAEAIPTTASVRRVQSSWCGAATEVFQASRHRPPQWYPVLHRRWFTRSLRLLDVSKIVRNVVYLRQRNYALDSAPHSRSRHGVCTIHGIVYRGRFTRATSITLFVCPVEAFPARLKPSLPLAHPALGDAIDPAAHELGYALLGLQE